MSFRFKYACLFLLPLVLSLNFCGQTLSSNSYGVFIGTNADAIDKLFPYKVVVIDASDFTADQITMLHEKGIIVYSYVNLGAIETYRSYYDEFSYLALDDYENWPEEKWLDVTSANWQSFLTQNLCRSFTDKGVDGLFLDNVDVYSQYPTDQVFYSIVSMLKSLKADNDCKIMINGGYDFFTKALSCHIPLTSLADSVNQESVFSAVNFETGQLLANMPADRDDALAYLKNLQKKGLTVYLTEYAVSPVLIKQIETYCRKNNFQYYISSSIDLN